MRAKSRRPFPVLLSEHVGAIVSPTIKLMMNRNLVELTKVVEPTLRQVLRAEPWLTLRF